MPRRQRRIYYNPWGQGGYEFDKWLLNLAPAEGQNAFEAQNAYNEYARNSEIANAQNYAGEAGYQGGWQGNNEAEQQNAFQNILSPAWEAERDNAKAAIEQAGQREAQGLNGPNGRPSAEDYPYGKIKKLALAVAKDNRKYIDDDFRNNHYASLIYSLFYTKWATSAKPSYDIIQKVIETPNCKLAFVFGPTRYSSIAAYTQCCIVYNNEKVYELDYNEPNFINTTNEILTNKNSKNKIVMLVIFDENSKKPDAETHPTITDRIKYADTFVHELQHVDIDFNSLLSSQPLLHPDVQHDMMNDKEDKYWKARYNFFDSYYDYWKVDLDELLARNLQGDIYQGCGSISNSNLMADNIKSYICRNIYANKIYGG